MSEAVTKINVVDMRDPCPWAQDPGPLPKTLSVEDMAICKKEWEIAGYEVDEQYLEPEARTHLEHYAEAIICLNQLPPPDQVELGLVNINFAQYGLVDGEWRLFSGEIPEETF
jgi:hypothetical protein